MCLGVCRQAAARAFFQYDDDNSGTLEPDEFSALYQHLVRRTRPACLFLLVSFSSAIAVVAVVAVCCLRVGCFLVAGRCRLPALLVREKGRKGIEWCSSVIGGLWFIV